MDERIISRAPLLASLPLAEITRLAKTLRRVAAPAGTVLFREGEEGDRFFILRSGQVAVVKGFGTPDQRLLGMRGEGDFVGEMSLLNRDGLRTATVWAARDTEMLEITRAQFDTLLRRHPSVAYDMLRVQSERLRSSQDAAMSDLSERNRQLAQAYADLKAAQGQLIEQEAMTRELHLANRIQMSMLPARLPHLPGFDIGARTTPARVVGGDFYDVFPLGGDRLGVAIGDVSGKGVPAALFMALTCTLLRAEARRVASPEEALFNVNRYLLDRNPEGVFVTVLYGVLYRSGRHFEYVRAGHDYPLLRVGSSAELFGAGGRSHILGVFSDPMLDAQMVTIPPGGALLLYTDGATEAMNEQDGFFGIERLQQGLLDCPECSAQGMCDNIIERVAAFRGEAPQSDDITLVALKADGEI